MKRSITTIFLLILCISCTTVRQDEAEAKHIAYCPDPFFQGIHLYRITINDKEIIPGGSISFSKEESKNVKVKFYIGNGFSNTIFARGNLTYFVKIPTDSEDSYIGNMNAWWSGRLTYTCLIPGSIMNDGKRFFCICRTLEVNDEFDLSDPMRVFDSKPCTQYILTLQLRYYLLNQGDNAERVEKFKIPIEIKIKDTEQKDALNSDSAVAKPE